VRGYHNHSGPRDEILDAYPAEVSTIKYFPLPITKKVSHLPGPPELVKTSADHAYASKKKLTDDFVAKLMQCKPTQGSVLKKVVTIDPVTNKEVVNFVIVNDDKPISNEPVRQTLYLRQKESDVDI
jgi:hypothetical protein